MPCVAVVVFTRDLRVTDHPALAQAAATADHVVPLFVFDDTILASRFNCPNRTGFLLESLADLDRELQALGGHLVVRRGSWAETVRAVARTCGANAVHLSDDVSGYARRRIERLEVACAADGVAVHVAPGATVVDPGAVTPDGDDHYKVFTPYFRRWSAAGRRSVVWTPAALSLPDGVDVGSLPALDDLVDGERSPAVMRGGTGEAHRRLDQWKASGLADYGDRHDDLPGDATSRLSPYLHFGCVSPLEVEHAVRLRAGAEPYVRQLCWRDFYHQILAARPDAAWSDYRDRGDDWRDDPEALLAWQEGHTGYPIVDAAMRQLREEGFMHNRARMIVASFLTKDLCLDWRAGAQHFLDFLLDGDLANNNLNWQWVAGTGTDTNPHRIFNPTVQGQRFDPDGDYVRRYVPELAAVHGGAVHDPESKVRRAYDYPEPIVDHRAAIAEYKARRVPG